MPTLPEHEPSLTPRLMFLLRIESYINVGAKYGPNDLEPQTWDHLLVLASERAFMDRLLDKRREGRRGNDAAMQKARQQTGLPAPGGTLFAHSKPFKGSTK